MATDTRTVRAATYCRMSRAADDDQTKVDRQAEDCRRVAERMGWRVVAEYVDNNKSAWQRTRSRPDWDAMLAAVEAGTLDAIIVYHGDRLIRQPYDLEQLLQIADRRGILLASPTGTRRLDSADDRFILRIEAAQACRESDNISRRVSRERNGRRAHGRPSTGGHRAYGFEPDRVTIREFEAEIIRDLAKRLLAGESARSLANELNEQGVPSALGGQWHPVNLLAMMRRPRIAGLLEHHGEIIGEAAWDPIVDRDMWETLRAVLDSRSADRPRHSTRVRYLLSGIAVCSGCGRGVAAKHPPGRPGLRYACTTRGCPASVARRMEPVDELVIRVVLRLLSSPQLWEHLDAQTSSADREAGAHLAALRLRRQQVVASFADDDALSPGDLRAMLGRLDERIADAQQRVGAAAVPRVLAGARDMTRAEWDELSLDRRRALVGYLVDVRILPTRPGRRFDPDGVSITRRLHA